MRKLPLALIISLVLIGTALALPRVIDSPAISQAVNPVIVSPSATSGAGGAATEPTPVKSPQMIEFYENGVLCVNCPAYTRKSNADVEIICTNTEKPCDLYFGFNKYTPKAGEGLYGPEQDLISNPDPETGKRKEYNYKLRLAKEDEFSAEVNNVFVKKVQAPAEAAYETQPPEYLPSIEGEPGTVLNEVQDKIIFTDEKFETAYDTGTSGSYLRLKNVIITLNTQGEIVSIAGASKKATTQKIAPIVGQGTYSLDIPLAITEKLTFKGIDGRAEYNIGDPTLEIYKPDPQEDLEKWLTRLDQDKIEGGTWWLDICDLSMPYYAPESKFQIIFGKNGCKISDYLLTTGATASATVKRQTTCGGLTYNVYPGKITELYCYTDKSRLDCRNNKVCKTSELDLHLSTPADDPDEPALLAKASETSANEITLGTNEFVVDGSNFEYLEITKDGFIFNTDEIKIGRDYILPYADVAVTTVPFITPLHAGLKVKDGTKIIREWLDRDTIHSLEKSTGDKPVNYIISIFHESANMPSRIDAIYPEYYSYTEHGMSYEEKNIYSMYGSVPEEEGDKLKVFDTFMQDAQKTKVFNLPTLGIKVTLPEYFSGTETYHYQAIPLNELKDRKTSETVAKAGAKKIDVSRGEDILDRISQYCYGQDYSNLLGEDGIHGDAEKQGTVREIAYELMKESHTYNQGFFKPAATEVVKPGQFEERTRGHYQIQKDGELMLPKGPIEFTSKQFIDQWGEGVKVTLRPAQCGLATSMLGKALQEKTEPKGAAIGKQQCASGKNFYIVQKGDSLAKIYQRKCTKKSGVTSGDFKTWVLDESNNPGLNDRTNWYDKISAKDRICIPDGCKLKWPRAQVPTKAATVPEETKEGKLQCPTGEVGDICDEAEIVHLEYGMMGRGISKDNCDAYATAISRCPMTCHFVQRGEGPKSGACILKGNAQYSKPSEPEVESAKTKKAQLARAQLAQKEGVRVSALVTQIEQVSIPEPIPGLNIKISKGAVEFTSTGSASTPSGSMSRDIPQITVKLTPNVLAGQIADFSVAGASIEKEQLKCRYTQNKNTITLQNKKKLEFTEIPDPRYLENMEYTLALNKARASYYNPKIEDFCKDLIVGGKLEYEDTEWEKL